MSTNPYDSPQMVGEAPQRKPGKARFTLVELLIVVGVIGVLIALLLPAVRVAREPARRMSCMNNLKQIGIALHNYQDEYHCLPPAYTVDASGRPLHSWRTLILPYLEQQALYDRIDLTKPWDDPANQAARDIKVSTYQCPSARAQPGHTTYVAVVGPSSCLQATKPRLRSEITDDPALTMVVMEADPGHAVHWMSPTDASEHFVVGFGESKRLSHREGAQALFVDGHVRFLDKNDKPAVLRALISIAGGDDEIAQEVR